MPSPLMPKVILLFAITIAVDPVFRIWIEFRTISAFLLFGIAAKKDQTRCF